MRTPEGRLCTTACPEMCIRTRCRRCISSHQRLRCNWFPGTRCSSSPRSPSASCTGNWETPGCRTSRQTDQRSLRTSHRCKRACRCDSPSDIGSLVHIVCNCISRPDQWSPPRSISDTIRVDRAGTLSGSHSHTGLPPAARTRCIGTTLGSIRYLPDTAGTEPRNFRWVDSTPGHTASRSADRIGSPADTACIRSGLDSTVALCNCLARTRCSRRNRTAWNRSTVTRRCIFRPACSNRIDPGSSGRACRGIAPVALSHLPLDRWHTHDRGQVRIPQLWLPLRRTWCNSDTSTAARQCIGDTVGTLCIALSDRLGRSSRCRIASISCPDLACKLPSQIRLLCMLNSCCIGLRQFQESLRRRRFLRGKVGTCALRSLD